LFLVVTSCNNDKLQKMLATSDRPDIDKIFHKIVQSESQETKGVAIVDRSINTKQINTNSKDLNIEHEPTYWTKEIFPQTTFISGDSIILFIKTNKTLQEIKINRIFAMNDN
jgi:hypothetical protein